MVCRPRAFFSNILLQDFFLLLLVSLNAHSKLNIVKVFFFSIWALIEHFHKSVDLLGREGEAGRV